MFSMARWGFTPACKESTCIPAGSCLSPLGSSTPSLICSFAPHVWYRSVKLFQSVPSLQAWGYPGEEGPSAIAGWQESGWRLMPRTSLKPARGRIGCREAVTPKKFRFLLTTISLCPVWAIHFSRSPKEELAYSLKHNHHPCPEILLRAQAREKVPCRQSPHYAQCVCLIP